MNYLTRRELLYGAGALLGSAALAVRMEADPQDLRFAKMVPGFYPPPAGTPEWDFWPTQPLHETALFLHSIGFQGMDISGREWALTPESILDAVKGTGIVVSNIGGRCSLLSPDPAVRAEGVKIDRKCLQMAKTLGCRTIGEHYFPSGETLGEEDMWVVNGLKELAPDLERTGTEIHLEPMYNEKITRPLDLESHTVRMIEAVGSPHIKVVSDFWHLASQKNDIGAELMKYGNRTGVVHLSEGPDRTQPGSFDFDYRPGFRALKKWGYARWIVLECHPTGNDPAGALEKSLDYVRRQWNEA